MNLETNNNRMLPSEVKDTLKQEGGLTTGEIERVWHLLGASNITSPINSTNSPSHISEKDEMWAQLSRQIKTGKIISENRDRPPLRPVRLFKSSRVFALAAAFTLLIIAGIFYWTLPVTIEASPGDIAGVTLPDGSSIELNSGTTLRYRRNFGALPFTEPAARFVELDGEAYFDVEKTGTPFTIQTFNASVGVLGTTFNVRARLEDNATEVILASGRVEVASRLNQNSRTILANPGDQVIVAGDAPMPELPVQGDVDASLIWRTRGFAAKNVPLKMVFTELERRYDVEITVEDQAIEEDSTIAINFPRPGSIETILGDICIYKNLNYRKTSRGYEIY